MEPPRAGQPRPGPSLCFLVAQPAPGHQPCREQQRGRLQRTLAASMCLCLLCAVSAAVDGGSEVGRQRREEQVAAHLQEVTVDLGALLMRQQRQAAVGRKAATAPGSASSGSSSDERQAGERSSNSRKLMNTTDDAMGSSGSGGGGASVGQEPGRAQQYGPEEGKEEDGVEDGRWRWARQGVHSRRQHPWPGPGGYLAMCVVVRDQGQDLLEWIEYHRWAAAAGSLPVVHRRRAHVFLHLPSGGTHFDTCGVAQSNNHYHELDAP
jgi:hypothetical protein